MLTTRVRKSLFVKSMVKEKPPCSTCFITDLTVTKMEAKRRYL